MNGSAASAGSGVPTLLTPSEPTSNANSPISRFVIGAVAAFRRFVPLTVRMSFSAP